MVDSFGYNNQMLSANYELRLAVHSGDNCTHYCDWRLMVAFLVPNELAVVDLVHGTVCLRTTVDEYMDHSMGVLHSFPLAVDYSWVMVYPLEGMIRRHGESFGLMLSLPPYLDDEKCVQAMNIDGVPAMKRDFVDTFHHYRSFEWWAWIFLLNERDADRSWANYVVQVALASIYVVEVVHLVR